jgi:transcriptional regulator with AAA-type ATPase domain
MAENEKTNGDWVITPGLSGVVDDFIRLYEYLKSKLGRKSPILILGDRGVGKSLFVRIYRKLYEKDNEKAKPKKVIRKINVAAIPKDLVEDMLFGHVKGAFTGAHDDKYGIVHESDLLILEEIGDLPAFVQAKLLTFLEDGEYYRVGETEPKNAKADLRIIATTNKTRNDMRPDFYDRFQKFTVPPLYERREDIFYYMLQFAPTILPTLKTWEIMALLAHPWPGNVRELAAVSLDIERGRLYIASKFKKALPTAISSLKYAKKEHTEIKKDRIRERYQSIQRAGIDVTFLEKLMNSFGLGFNPDNLTAPWRKKDFSSPLSSSQNDKKRDALLGTNTYRTNIFFSIKTGLQFYGDLFLRVENGPVDLLLVRSEEGRNLNAVLPLCYFDKRTKKHDALVKSILEYCLMRQINKSMRSTSLVEMETLDYAEWVKKAFGISIIEPEEDRDNDEGEKSKKNPFDMKRDDLLKAYCQYLLNKAGTIKNAAALAGMNKNTFYSMLKKLDIV